MIVLYHSIELKAKHRYHRSFPSNFNASSPNPVWLQLPCSHPSMAAISNSLVLSRSSLLSENLHSSASTNLSFNLNGHGRVQLPSSRKSLVVRASKSDGGSSSAGIFVGGFVLGGLIVGALGCVYAPQISKALAGTDRKEIMRKLPKFIYDEEKALEKTRKILTQKIEQLNSAIDEVSSQLHPEDATNGVAVNSDEIEAAI